MLCYKDRTWCGQTDCANWGKDCDRSLTEEVMEAAQEWWNKDNDPKLGMAPICMFADKPHCFEEKK